MSQKPLDSILKAPGRWFGTARARRQPPLGQPQPIVRASEYGEGSPSTPRSEAGEARRTDGGGYKEGLDVAKDQREDSDYQMVDSDHQMVDSDHQMVDSDHQMVDSQTGQGQGGLASNDGEGRGERVRQFVHEALKTNDDSTGSLSLLRDDDDGQLAIDEVWKLLFQSSTLHGGGERTHGVLKRLLLGLIVKFSILPDGPVFTDPVGICPDPILHLEARDHDPAQVEDSTSVEDPESCGKYKKAQEFIKDALKLEQGSDPVSLLPGDIDGQVVIDECWNMLTSADSSNDQKAKIRRLCLKLVLALGVIPSAMTLEGVRFSEADLLGTGSFADVFRGEYRRTTVAVKRFRVFTKMTNEQRQDLLKSLHREAFLWKLLDHQHILPFLGVSADSQRRLETITLVSPLAGNGGIRDYIQLLQSQEKLSTSGIEFDASIHRWLHQISSGVAYLHDQGIVHGDLHCGNILVSSAGNIQLTDFGLALIADATSYNYGSVHGGGAIFTRAPELLDPDATTTRPTQACDVYAFAFICLELFTGSKAFPDVSDLQVPNLILSGKRPPRPPSFSTNIVRHTVWALIITCWDKEPRQRPQMDAIFRTMENLIHPTISSLSVSSHRELCRLNLSHVSWHSCYTLFHDYFVVGGDDGSIHVYCVSTKKLIHTLHGHHRKPTQMAGTGAVLVSASPSEAVRIWDLHSGSCLYILEIAHDISNLTITSPEMVNLGGSNWVNAETPPAVPSIVYTTKDTLVVLTFPPLLAARHPGREPLQFPAEKVPYLRHRIGLGNGLWSDQNLKVQGNFAAAISRNFHVDVWDTVSGERKWRVELPKPKYFRGPQICLDVSRGIVVTPVDAALVWDLHTGECLRAIELGESDWLESTSQIPGSHGLYRFDRPLFRFSRLDPMAGSPAKIVPLPVPYVTLSKGASAHNRTHLAYFYPPSCSIIVAEIKSGLMVANLPVGEGGVLGRMVYMTERYCAFFFNIGSEQDSCSQLVAWRLDDVIAER